MRNDEEVKRDVQALFEAWSVGSGVSDFCGDLLRGLHRGEGTVDVRAVPRLDASNFNASVGLMIAARYGFPIDGIRSYLDERQFAALFAEPDAGPSGPSI